ncbi:hypothetical protein KIV56_14300 [Cryobacterium breve]|uniref:Uncharacterized protein n=1 Tax=Cryobacterium breve TaxID=1259258 RepID=A0ABY7NB35_9MICO|nr:hypothetical protein [Cryobacterium breve]WBM79494.1 hypothetical protein KIV56_14300 [Cryobacterium breve]
MLTLDANPGLRAKALGIDKTVATAGLSVVEAEAGTISGGTVVTPPSAWTGEANLSGGAYVSLTKGGTLSIPVPESDQARNVYPIVNQTEARSGNTSWASARGALGSTANGGAGAQGITDAPGRLLPLSLSRTLPAGATAVTGTSSGAAAIDALLLQPLVSTVSVTGPAGDSTLYVSTARESSVRTVLVPRGFRLEQAAYDAAGRPVAHADERGNPARASVTVAPGGFTVTHLARR